jgi:hypothetical protein
MLYDQLKIPLHIEQGIKPLKRGMQMHVIPVGIDTETKHGEPITFQFFSKTIDLEKIIWLKSGKTATKSFFDFCDSLPSTRNRHYVFFGHNLAFDMVSIFWDRHSRLRDESIKSEVWYGWKVEIVYAAVRFAVFKKGHKSITLIDTGAYFSSPPRPLWQLAEIFCPDLPKLQAPKRLGSRSFKPSDKRFCAYAMRDAEIAYYVGLFLLERHKEWDVSLSVSGPHFASKVFRRHFLKKSIPLPPRKITYAALSSYHGGKNNITCKTGLYKNVYSLDIKSAYPHAMSIMPSFSNPDLYKILSGKGTPDSFPPYGIYKISGVAKKCKWPSIFSHNFKPIQGEFSGIWITGFEINESLRSNEVSLSDTFGYFYDADADKEPSPFKNYVDEFYKRKEISKDKPQREFNKLLMNALYGKFIQTRHLVNGMSDLVFDLDEKKLLEDSSIQAGGLFNPFIATLITGHCRAVIHRREHEFKAIHTATDGIFANNLTQKQIRKIRKACTNRVGDFSIEHHGDCLIFRNKLYIFYARMVRKDYRDKSIKRSTIFKGKKIIKNALHGFHGTVFALEKLWKTNTREYEYIKVNKLRESLRRKLKVNDFVSQTATLKVS